MLTIKENLMELIEDGQTDLWAIERMLNSNGGDTDDVVKDLTILSCIESLVSKLKEKQDD